MQLTHHTPFVPQSVSPNLQIDFKLPLALLTHGAAHEATVNAKVIFRTWLTLLETQTVLYISHRVNTSEHLSRTSVDHGVELDLRDHGNDLVLQHDPFQEEGERFSEYLRNYRHGLMILNVKSERIEWRVLDAIRDSEVQDYFFLDSSFPMIRQLIAKGERRIAVRFSEFEPLESALALAGEIEWVWVDCFTRMPLNDHSYHELQKNFKLCIVSPELHGRSLDTIPTFAETLKPYKVDAICTKRPNIWQGLQGSIGS